MTDNHLHIFYKGNKNKIEYKQKDIRGTTIWTKINKIGK
jgi:hypothetical protein